MSYGHGFAAGGEFLMQGTTDMAGLADLRTDWASVKVDYVATVIIYLVIDSGWIRSGKSLVREKPNWMRLFPPSPYTLRELIFSNR